MEDREIILKASALEKIKEIARAEGCGMAKGHTQMSEETKMAISTIVDAVNNLKKENKEDHSEIIKHQKHTNGDVSRLKIWQARVIGGTVVVIAFLGFISTSYFMEKGNQEEKFEAVIRMQEQINSLTYQLNKLDLTE